MEEKNNGIITTEAFKAAARERAVEVEAMRQEAFRNGGILSFRHFSAVGRYRSVRRAMRRGHVSLYGDIYPKRPFNNRKRGKGTETYNRRKVYEQLTGRAVI